MRSLVLAVIGLLASACSDWGQPSLRGPTHPTVSVACQTEASGPGSAAIHTDVDCGDRSVTTTTLPPTPTLPPTQE